MLNKKSHKCYKLMYHLIIVVKYRKNDLITINTNFNNNITDGKETNS